MSASRLAPLTPHSVALAPRVPWAAHSGHLGAPHAPLPRLLAASPWSPVLGSEPVRIPGVHSVSPKSESQNKAFISFEKVLSEPRGIVKSIAMP